MEDRRPDGKARPPGRRPLVGSAAAALLAVIAWGVLAGTLPLAYLPALIAFAAFSLPLAVIDLEDGLLPNRLTLPAAALGVVLAILASALTGLWAALLDTALAGAAMFSFYLLVALAYPDGMGAGDVKLAGVIGVVLGWLGWPHVVVGACAGFVIGAVVGVVLMVGGKATGSTPIPFGPSMLAGAWVGVFAG